VTTLPAARGRGIGSVMVMAPLLSARRHGYRVGILQSSKMGHPVYLRLGFQDFGMLSVYLWGQEAKL
jgi:GNAT superfamily N-acetyltransferase